MGKEGQANIRDWEISSPGCWPMGEAIIGKLIIDGVWPPLATHCHGDFLSFFANFLVSSGWAQGDGVGLGACVAHWAQGRRVVGERFVIQICAS